MSARERGLRQNSAHNRAARRAAGEQNRERVYTFETVMNYSLWQRIRFLFSPSFPINTKIYVCTLKDTTITKVALQSSFRGVECSLKKRKIEEA